MVVSVQSFMQLGGCVDILHPFIWSSVSGLIRFRDESHKETSSNFVQVLKKV
jgi:hypothetical protein